MTTPEVQQRSPIAVLLGAVLALGLARAVIKAWGLFALLGVVVATVAALVIGILVLKVALGA